MRALVQLFALLVVLALPAQAAAAPSAELWPRWQAHDANATAAIDHSGWDGFLRTYVKPGGDGVNRVAYSRVSEQDRQGLAVYIDRLSEAPISKFNRAEQFAYWVNLYNALTIELVLKRYPVESIKDINISPGLFASGPWGRKLVKVEGQDVSLDDIEHRILRPIWRDPRIHYAVNCAAIGCPNLMPEAFTARNTEALLEKAARVYVNHSRAAHVSGGRLVVSRIYEWYQADFGGGAAGVMEHLKRYADPQLRQALQGIGSIAEYRYDWALNDARG